MNKKTIIDAGVEKIRFHFFDSNNNLKEEINLSSNSNFEKVFDEENIFEKIKSSEVFITGKLAEIVKDILKMGKVVLPVAALWSQAIALTKKKENSKFKSLAIIDLSASGYLIVGIKKNGELKNDTLVVNPRCGAGSGVNLDRVLQKLNIKRSEVDSILSEYLGKEGEEKRKELSVRADRCGVFSSSATISDKNQGIPLSFALAVTLKSEVMKTCRKLKSKFDKVYLTGGVLSWQFTYDCAKDYLKELGIEEIEHDKKGDFFISGVQSLSRKIDPKKWSKPEQGLRKEKKLEELPSFSSLKKKFEEEKIYKRLPYEEVKKLSTEEFEKTPVGLGLDVGSTMAKLLAVNAVTEEIIFLNSYSNSGDTIETIKQIFRDLESQEVKELNVQYIGITGSARYQVQQTLTQLYPQIADQISVLVENYAHARGSIEFAKKHIENLKKEGVKNINEDFCTLVDIGGEDTKLSTIALEEEELFDNAMNVKCSAGTGSLMDTLTNLFDLEDISKTCRAAFNAPKAYSINATCAVFLMENARKLQTKGFAIDEILASANWAIVENMARTLWQQINLPKNAVVLLHGQTMLSEPLPLATTQRLQEFTGSKSFFLVPPHPGHRACIGLTKTLSKKAKNNNWESQKIVLKNLIDQEFEKKIIQCQGAACGDKDARCNRIFLSCSKGEKKFCFTLGGCTAINELLTKKTASKDSKDYYKEIWNFFNDHNPKSDDPRRIIIPRSFAVSEWAFFILKIFENLDLPVCVDNIQKEDIVNAQPLFRIDTCAPHIGAVGQYQRLAKEKHGMIVAPQLEFLPTEEGNESLGKTCTLNQGGVAVAKSLAETANKNAHFLLFKMNLRKLNAKKIANQLHPQLQKLFKHYKINPSVIDLEKAVKEALTSNQNLKKEAKKKVVEILENAIEKEKQVAIVVGREYLLNPGIFDSHVGRLLRDKDMVAIPSYVLDVKLNKDFEYVYWRNPNTILSIIKAVNDKNLHRILKDEKLSELFEKIENNPKNLLPIIQVSTFLCGPDSVTNPFVAELVKNRPFLLIQSDAVIKELAHLENRVNTYVKQLEQGLQEKLLGTKRENFEVKLLDNFVDNKNFDKKTDIFYLPTLWDNRTVSSVFRAAGFDCVDNYSDEVFDLERIVKKGRRFAGDMVCAPLSAVYGDILEAVEDFRKQKEAGNPLFQKKKRIFIFMHETSGPCRQGQYPEVHKLLAHQKFGDCENCQKCSGKKTETKSNNVLKFLVANQDAKFDFGVEEWVFFRAFQGLVLQGVLQQLLFTGGESCKNIDEYKKFTTEYRKLKKEIFDLFENKLKPTKKQEKIAKNHGRIPMVGWAIKYFCYKIYDRSIQKKLANFSKKWIKEDEDRKKIKIHMDGEVYMRVAQGEDIFHSLLSSLGFQRFNLTSSPVWAYIDYVINENKLDAIEKIKSHKWDLRKNIKELKNLISFLTIEFVLRKVIARPLYKNAKVEMPEPMSLVLKKTKGFIPTSRPTGELRPYAGEAILKTEEDYDLFLNVAPEGCMVASMGEALTPKLAEITKNHHGRIQNLFSSEGDVDEELLSLSLLKTLGPIGFYERQ